jgi:hypothetical protein
VEHIRAVENTGVGVLLGSPLEVFTHTGPCGVGLSTAPPGEGVVRNSVVSRNFLGVVAGIGVAIALPPINNICPFGGSGRFNILQNTTIANTGGIDMSCPSVIVQNAASVIVADGPGCTRSDNTPAPRSEGQRSRKAARLGGRPDAARVKHPG